jgi:ABC-type molybdenum transport system ATPase subunit/photorepair protein PhrA
VWVFEDKVTDNGPNPCESFGNWLSSGNGIFHIAGKLGSGKSTLMKFLCDHQKTKTELQKWAGMSYARTLASGLLNHILTFSI